MKMAGTGATFPSTLGAQRVLETSMTTKQLLYDPNDQLIMKPEGTGQLKC
jgi:hypothetical protein